MDADEIRDITKLAAQTRALDVGLQKALEVLVELGGPEMLDRIDQHVTRVMTNPSNYRSAGTAGYADASKSESVLMYVGAEEGPKAVRDIIDIVRRNLAAGKA